MQHSGDRILGVMEMCSRGRRVRVRDATLGYRAWKLVSEASPIHVGDATCR